MNEEDINKRVFLLAILKKESSETLLDVTKSLVNAGMFDLKDGKKLLGDLKKLGYVANEQLTFTGIAIAQEAEKEFKQ
jgi:hypothetical protein